MAHKRSHSRRAFRLPPTAALFYLLLCTTLATGVSFSRYVARDTGGYALQVTPLVLTASAQVSESSLTLDCSTGTSSSAEYVFAVSREAGGVNFRYDVVIKLDTPLPEGVRMRLDNAVGQSDDDGKEYVFAGQSFSDGSVSSNTHYLTFEADDPAGVTQAANIQVSVDVVAEQTT